ncbi:hypothetical protein ABI125_05480 [Tamlana crocina]
MAIDFLSMAILILLLSLAIYTLKVYFNTKRIKGEWLKSQSDLQKQIVVENQKNKWNTEKLTLVDNLHESLFKNLFYITRQILLMQKMIVDSKN